jgi:Flp pilus assembly protein TadD
VSIRWHRHLAMVCSVAGALLIGTCPTPSRAQAPADGAAAAAGPVAAAGSNAGQDPQQVLAAEQIDAYTEAGRQRLASGDARGALEQFNAASRLAPNDAALVNNVAAAQAAAGNIAEALALLHHALDIDPQRSDIRANLIRLQAWASRRALPADSTSNEAQP